MEPHFEEFIYIRQMEFITISGLGVMVSFVMMLVIASDSRWFGVEGRSVS